MLVVLLLVLRRVMVLVVVVRLLEQWVDQCQWTLVQLVQVELSWWLLVEQSL